MPLAGKMLKNNEKFKTFKTCFASSPHSLGRAEAEEGPQRVPPPRRPWWFALVGAKELCLLETAGQPSPPLLMLLFTGEGTRLRK